MTRMLNFMKITRTIIDDKLFIPSWLNLHSNIRAYVFNNEHELLGFILHEIPQLSKPF